MVLPVIKQTILTLYEILNLEGHLNRSIGSKVTVFLMNGWTLPTVGAAGLFYKPMVTHRPLTVGRNLKENL